MSSEARAQLCEDEKLRPSQTANPSGSLFGLAVDIDGDTAVVGGSKLNGPGGTPVNTGGVYVYLRNPSLQLGERWEIQQTLFTPPMPMPNDQFGQAVAISGDTLLVGAPNDNPAGFFATGRAHVFVRSGGTWSHQATLAPPADATGALFGITVAIDGDLAVVGAQGDLDGAPPAVSTGAAYVFERSGNPPVWGTAVKLLASSRQAGDAFGSSVAVHETSRTVVVGAKFDDHGAGGPANAGSAYVFDDSSGSWGERHVLMATAPAPFASDEFGCSIAYDGTTIAIGACRADHNQLNDDNRGAVYLFSFNGTSWVQHDRVIDDFGDGGDGGDDNDLFGRSVDVEGGVLIVGAKEAEQAFRFDRSGSSWPSTPPALLSGNASSDADFGFAVATSAGRVLIGAQMDDTAPGSDEGSAYVFAPFAQTHEFYGTPEPTGLVGCDGSTLSVTGAASMTASTPFLIRANDATCTNVNGATYTYSGTLIWGVEGRASLPLGNGTTLVKSQIRVVTVFELLQGQCPTSGNLCGRVVQYDFNETIQSGAYPSELFAGQTVNVQWILNNGLETDMPPNEIPPNGQANFKETTNAVEFHVCP